jgi:hypothetical protein
MLKKLMFALALAALAVPAIAEIGTIDDVPAATLLLPYFEVDLDDPLGLTTLFSINNASAAPALVHIVVWTDLSIHVLDFNVYLTGYDVFTQNLRDLFINGTSPLTEDTNDADAISPVGIYSLVDNPDSGVGPGLPGCELPYSEPLLSALYVDHIQATLTGQPSDVLLDGGCAGIDHGDRIARGYITMDNVNDCSLNFPEDAPYFGDGEGTPRFAVNINQLWGDYFYVNPTENFAQGETLVHIEADADLGVDNYTFYYRYSAGDDEREGLGSTFAVRYLDGGAFTGGTDLLVWRDAKVDTDTFGDGLPEPDEDDGFSCGLSYPDPFPLGNTQVVIFDEDENPEVPEGCQISPCPPGIFLTPFPWEAQRTEVGSGDLPVSEPFGWLYLNLNLEIPGTPVQEAFGDVMQNWVTAVMDADGRFSVGFDAIQLDNVTYPAEASNVSLPICDGAPDPEGC